MEQKKLVKKSEKDIIIKINDGVTFRILIDVTKDFLGDVNFEIKRDPDMEKDNEKTDKIEKQNSEKKTKKTKKDKEIEQDIENPNTEDKDKKTEQKKKNEFYGIKIVAVNPSKSLIILIKLDSKKFGVFKVSKPVYDIGINLSQLHKLIKNIDKEDIMTLSIDSDEKHMLNIDVENEVKSQRIRNRLRTLDIDKKQYKIPDTRFDMCVTMISAEFHRICKDLAQLSEYVEIMCKENSITFTSQGDCSDKSVTISASDANNNVKIQPLEKNKGLFVQGIFELKYFTMFQKCAGLCANIQIYMKNAYPIFIKYHVASLGQIFVGISPVERDLNNNNFSDDEDDNENIKDKQPKQKDSDSDGDSHSDTDTETESDGSDN